MPAVISELMIREGSYTLLTPDVSGETAKKKTTVVSTITGAPQGPSSFLGVGNLMTQLRGTAKGELMPDPYTEAITKGWYKPVSSYSPERVPAPETRLRQECGRLLPWLAEGVTPDMLEPL